MNRLLVMRVGLIWIGILSAFISYGQLVHADQAPLGVLPMQYNSSFAGQAEGPRFSTSFNFEVGDKANNGQQYDLHTSYDQFIPAIRSGLGITTGFYSTDRPEYEARGHILSISVAPKFSMKGKYTLSPSLDLTYRYGKAALINFPVFNGTSTTLQSRLGLLFNTDKYYIGYSVNIADNLLPKEIHGKMRFLSFFQLGYSFRISSESKFSFTPQIVIRIAEKQVDYIKKHIDLEAINLTFKYRQFIWGGSNSGLHLGWQTEKFKAVVAARVGTPSSKRLVAPYFYVVNLSFRYLIK